MRHFSNRTPAFRAETIDCIVESIKNWCKNFVGTYPRTDERILCLFFNYIFRKFEKYDKGRIRTWSSGLQYYSTDYPFLIQYLSLRLLKK